MIFVRYEHECINMFTKYVFKVCMHEGGIKCVVVLLLLHIWTFPYPEYLKSCPNTMTSFSSRKFCILSQGKCSY